MRPVLESVRRKRLLTKFVLVLEQLSIALWHSVFWAVAFCGVWLLGVSEFLSPSSQVGLSALFFIGLLYLSIRGIRGMEWPTQTTIDRRLELASKARHRPLSILEDTPVNQSSSETKTLWERAKSRTIQTLSSLRPPEPQALIARRDPYGLRLFAVLLLIAGTCVAGQDWDARLKTGLFPVKAFLPEGLPKTITLTITPPAYTGKPQILISGPGWSREILEVPIGSSLKATAKASFGTPSLTLGDQSHLFEAQGEGNFTLAATITQGEQLGVSRFGLPVMQVPVHIVPDNPPGIDTAKSDKSETEAPPEAFTTLPDKTLRFALSAVDDYGVKDLYMTMTLDPMIEDAPLGKPEEDIRAVTSAPGKPQRIDPVYDFTASPWAGLPAIVTFSVTDHAGQTGVMKALSLTLPEREFRHPIAQALIAQRKALIWAPMAPPDSIVGILETILLRPDVFQNDPIALLGIRVASARLKYAIVFKQQNLKNSQSVVDLLWDTALRIEDGNLSLAARNLRDAQRELENALREGKMSKEEMMQLTDKVSRLLQEYLAELQEELQKRMQNGEQLPFMPPEMMTQQLDKEKLDGFMQQMLEEMMNGNPGKAQEMLSQLQKMLDSMNPSLARPMPMDMQMMDQGISEMQQLIERQEELLAQTKLQAETMAEPMKAMEKLKDLLQLNPEMLENLQGAPAEVDTQDNKIEQEALRYVLGQLMLDAGEIFKDIPKNLGLAEMEMRESSGRLGENRPDHAIAHQEAAVKHLKEAQSQMQKELSQKMQQMMAGSGPPMFFSMPSFGNRQLDPLGRPLSGNPQDGDPNSLYAPVEIPDEAERQRAQEIQKLLRDRSGEHYRPPEELEYFRRLLKQF